jgi:hypothetical protein
VAAKKKAPARPALQPVSELQRSLLDLAEALTQSAKGNAKPLAPPPAVIVTERAAALRLQQLAKAHLPAASRRPAVQGKPAARKK